MMLKIKLNLIFNTSCLLKVWGMKVCLILFFVLFDRLLSISIFQPAETYLFWDSLFWGKWEEPGSYKCSSVIFFFHYRTLRWQNLKASCKCADFYIRVSSKPSRDATGKLVRSELTSESFRFVDEIFSILSSTRTRASVTLAGKRDSGRHSTTSFSETS